jgi:hypothetical protein
MPVLLFRAAAGLVDFASSMKQEAPAGGETRAAAVPAEHRTRLVTLVFTDLVGSTQLKQELGDRQALALIQRHHAVVRELLAGFEGGREISTSGDSFFLIFSKPSDAVKFAFLLLARLHDVFLDRPPFYVEMDYVEGKDLRTWSAERVTAASPGPDGVGRVPLEVRLEIAAQAADALQAAHEAGVIHRDVKPANILIHDRSRTEAVPPGSGASACMEPGHGRSEVLAKLTDFGIGQVVSEEALRGITRAGFTQTMVSDSSTSRSGTQLYMAPELLAGRPASTRSDIYSLGVVLLQLLTGDFTRPVTIDWWKEITDPLLREDLEHCLAGDPQNRFVGAGQLAKQLRALPARRAALERQLDAQAARERAAYRRGVARADPGNRVLSVAFSNRHLAIGYREGELILREIGTWQEAARLRAHEAFLLGLAFSPDGALVATGGDEQAAHLWDVATLIAQRDTASSLRPVRVLRGHRGGRARVDVRWGR